MAQTIFERYGGFAQFSQIVAAFYDKILDNPVTSPYFANTDMRRLIDHQTKFVASLVGGPASYSDEALARIHSHLAISENAFAEMASLLKETLEDFELEAVDVIKVCNEIFSRRHLVVKK